MQPRPIEEGNEWRWLYDTVKVFKRRRFLKVSGRVLSLLWERSIFFNRSHLHTILGQASSESPEGGDAGRERIGKIKEYSTHERKWRHIYLQAYNVHKCICTVLYCVYLYVCLSVKWSKTKRKVHIHNSSMHMEECLLYLVAFGVSYMRDWVKWG